MGVRGRSCATRSAVAPDEVYATVTATGKVSATVLIAAVDTLQQSMEQLAAQLDVYVA